jgi:Mg-chelatase subunit ChlD
MNTIVSDERGASEVLGTVLLVSLVLTAALITLSLGREALGEAQSQNDIEQSQTVLQDVDAELTTLTRSEDSTSIEVNFGETNPKQYRLVDRGHLNLTVNDRDDCSVSLPLNSLRYGDEDGSTVAYQGGGVWRSDGPDGSGMITRPSVTYRAGTIDVSIINVSGTVDQAPNLVEHNLPKSDTRSKLIGQELTAGSCTRPDNVTLTVQSDFHAAWNNYLESEFGVDATVDGDNRTVRVRLDQSDLPVRTDDSRNDVVNLSGSGYMDVVDIDDSSDPPSIMIDKGVNNTYDVSVTPLHQGTPPIGNVTDIEGGTDVGRPPLDVMFVLDESGSMGNKDGDSDTRSEEAQDAAKRFVGGLNGSKDRAGITSYDNSGRYRLTDNNEYISSDFSEVNESIEDVPTGGGTESQKGMVKANTVFDLQSDESRDKVMILLTDGVNDDCQEWIDGTGWVPGPETSNGIPDDCTDNTKSLERARNAAANGVTIYTVGYGGSSQIDEAFLEEVAAITDGEFYQATDASELDSVFQDIRRTITETQVIGRSPVSGNFTVSGRVFGPQVPGSDDQVARFSIGGHDFQNINDPSTSSQYGYTFSATGGDDVTMEAYRGTCADGEWADTGRTTTHNGSTYIVARCTDIASSNSITPDEIYLDGDDISPLVHGINYSDVWQEDINQTFAAHDEIGVNATTGELEMKSNQALVYYDLPDSDESTNHLLLVYEIGLAESDVQAVGAINAEVGYVEFEG